MDNLCFKCKQKKTSDVNCKKIFYSDKQNIKIKNL